MIRHRGFTLVEVLVSGFILVLMMIALIAIFNTGVANFQFADISAVVNSESRLAARRISSDLRQTSPNWVIITQNLPVAGSDKIRFRLLPDNDADGKPDVTATGEPDWNNGTDITLSFDPVNNALVKTVGTEQTVVARYVKRVNFINQAINPSLQLDELRMVLEVERMDFRGRLSNLTLTSTINMRN